MSYLGGKWGCEDEFPPAAVILMVMVEVTGTAWDTHCVLCTLLVL